ELRRLLRQSVLRGTAFFRGNDRSPDPTATEVGRAVAEILSGALPEVFDRFEVAAARVAKNDLDALMKSDNLSGLPAVFTQLKLVREEAGKPVIHVAEDPLAAVL